MRQVRANNNWNPKSRRFQYIMNAGISKTTAYIGDIGITVDFRQNPNGIDDKNIKIAERFIVFFWKQNCFFTDAVF